MAKQPLLVVVAVMASVLAACCADAAGTVYDVLAKNNLPRGLLPSGARSYTLTPQGKLDVTFPGECSFTIQSYKMKFAASVGGAIQPGSINEFHGLSLHLKFAWLGVTRVERSGDSINLYVQNSSKPSISLPINSFAQSPSCS